MLVNDENVPSNKLAMSKNLKKTKTIEETYTKKTQLEHILLRPDTYIGSIEKQTQAMWVYDSETSKIVNKQITYVPGLFKIFDEIMVNAADNKQRDATMNRIEVTINQEENYIRVWNNGQGIPVAIHQEHQIYVPELIFGNLLTGSNFDDEEQKTTGGRNGYGAKLANIFSTKFIVETVDGSRNLKYKQEFSNNMTNKGSPKVTSFSSGSDFTSITFFPDLARFKMDSLDDDIIALLSKRVYDVAGTSNKVNVYLNGEKLVIKKFEDYLGLYEGIEAPIAFERVNDRWEIGIGVSDGSFQQVSFVNSICTSKGGCHVNYIADQVTAKLAVVVKKKNKGEEVKPNQIKNHLAIFINALVVNPAFDSQTKENLTTKSSAFGSTCVVPEKMLKAIEKSNIIDNILSWAKFKQTAELKKKSGSKKSKILGIPKLDDANCAGTSKSAQCTLILTEGDSAKALAISGLGVVGRDYYGVFPLKGKLLNVREASHQQIMKNEEIQNISKILGLTFGKTYEDISSLRYGHLMIMTDQDHDGSHIKGLLINFLHYFWPSLLQIPNFLQQFITPIVKCIKGKKELSFFTIPEYQAWRTQHQEGKGWKIKYYKGLGTSTASEAKDYFSNLQTHEINFQWNNESADMIDMAFAKKRVDDRKLWLLGLEPGVHIDYNVEHITYDNFVNHELILFSHADNERSIAHFMDGLKPSQRKVLFACFKRNLRQEIKVAQLAGYVSEQSAYHHGEASLTQTIISMAQNFIGSNNINLLSPCGQFGTRLMGGKDAASPRYVFTKLETITRYLFHPDDDALLEYLDDDGQSIEPVYYVPIIPMVLVNGSEGIGTGWSSSIPTYNPREIISNLRMMIQGDAPQDMVPWYRSFTGNIEEKAGKDNSFAVSGTIEVVDDQTVRITELPIGKWTTDYKQYLESVLIGNAAAAANKDKEDGEKTVSNQPFIKDFKENHTDTSVLFTVTLAPEKLQEIIAEKGGLIKKFKLDTSISTTNMNLFDLGSQIKKYDGPLPVLKDFFNIRMQYYDQRKNLLIKQLTEDWEKLDNKMKFLLAVIHEEIIVSNRKKRDLLRELKVKGFKAFVEKKSEHSTTGSTPVSANNSVTGDEESDGEVKEEVLLENGYDYLLSMKLWNLTLEKVQELQRQRDTKHEELQILLRKTSEDLYLNDLSNLERALDEFDAMFDEAKRYELAAKKKAARNAKTTNGGSKSKAVKKPLKKKSANSDDEDDEEDSLSDNMDEDDDFEVKKPAKKAPLAKTKSVTSTTSAISTVKQPTLSKTSTISSTTSVATAVSTASAASKSSNVLQDITAKTTSTSSNNTITKWMQTANTASTTASTATAVTAPTLSISAPAKAETTKAAKTTKATATKTTTAAAATTKKPAAKKASSKMIDLVDSEDDANSDEKDTDLDEPVNRPGRAARDRKQVVYTIEDSEASVIEDSDEDSASEISFSDENDSDDYNSDDSGKPKKKAAAAAPPPPVAAKKPAATKAAAPAKTTVKATAAAKTADSTTAVTKPAAATKKAAPAAKKPAAAKKSKKAASSDDEEEDEDDDDESFDVPSSPVRKGVKRSKKVIDVDKIAETPEKQPAKKSRAAPAKKATTTTATAVAATKPAAPAKKPVASKAKKSSWASDDEMDLVDSPVATKPKSTRAKKTTTNYKNFYSDDEEEEDSFIVEDDESDFDE